MLPLLELSQQSYHNKVSCCPREEWSYFTPMLLATEDKIRHTKASAQADWLRGIGIISG